MELIVSQIDQLKNLGLLTQVIPSSDILRVYPSVIELKYHELLTTTDSTKDIEDAISGSESVYAISGSESTHAIGGSESVYAIWDYIWNEETWNAAYNKENSALKKYYDVNPMEDLWNESAHRSANFNDRLYVSEVYADAEGLNKIADYDFKAGWGESYQSLTSGDVKYYVTMNAQVGSGMLYELFMDDAGSVSTNLYVKLLSVSYPDCTHCWEGAVKAPGAKYPWCVVNLDIPYEGIIKFDYEGQEVYPWGSSSRVFNGGYAIASIPVELGEQYLLDDQGQTTFKPDDLIVTLK